MTLSGKLRTITNVPGGMWLQDIRNGIAADVAHQQRIGIRGLAPGAKRGKELGWFGWVHSTRLQPDGKKVLFEEEGEGGGPNYTVFLRDTTDLPPCVLARAAAWRFRPIQVGVTKPHRAGRARRGPDRRG